MSLCDPALAADRNTVGRTYWHLFLYGANVKAQESVVAHVFKLYWWNVEVQVEEGTDSWVTCVRCVCEDGCSVVDVSAYKVYSA